MNFDLLIPSGGGGVIGGLRTNYLLPCCVIRDSFLFDMQHDNVLNKLNFDLLTLFPRVVGVCGQNICYHVAAFRNSLYFDMQHNHVMKKMNFDLLTPSRGGGGGGDRWSAYKLFATMLRRS